MLCGQVKLIPDSKGESSQQKRKTRTIRESLNPVWEETLSL